MFEFLLLTSIALIIFSQELPTLKQKNHKTLTANPQQSANKPETKTLSQAMQKPKKQPRRNVFDRAA